jgi:hypothetical protein
VADNAGISMSYGRLSQLTQANLDVAYGLQQFAQPLKTIASAAQIGIEMNRFAIWT